MERATKQRYSETSRGKKEKFNRRHKSVFKKLQQLSGVCDARFHLVIQRNKKYYVSTSEESTESWPPSLEKIVRCRSQMICY
jgi:SRF-type transcription factor (DNA-binding and dimerisation domain)